MFRRRRPTGTWSGSLQPRQARGPADSSARSASLGAGVVFDVSLPAPPWSPLVFVVGDSVGPTGASPGGVAPSSGCSACCCALFRVSRVWMFATGASVWALARVVSWLALPAAGACPSAAEGAAPRSCRVVLVDGSSGAGATPGVAAPRPACLSCRCAAIRALRRRFLFRSARARSPAACRSRAGGENGAVSAAPESGRPWSGGIRRASALSHCFRRFPMASDDFARSSASWLGAGGAGLLGRPAAARAMASSVRAAAAAFKSKRLGAML